MAAGDGERDDPACAAGQLGGGAFVVGIVGQAGVGDVGDARVGGEEFGAILPGASVGAAYIAAERIRVAFADACASLNDGMIKATVSAGIAQVQNGSTLDSLVQAADLALYRAKLQGRDRVEVAEKNDPVEDQTATLKVA